MFKQTVSIFCVVALGAIMVSCNPYGPTYNEAHEQSEYQAAPSYKPEPAAYAPPQQYQAAPAYHKPAPVYHQPTYTKYSAPSSAHHTQYDNYYPKQTYSAPSYSGPAYQPSYQPSYQPKPMYQAPQPAYKPSYQAPSYESADYAARA